MLFRPVAFSMSAGVTDGAAATTPDANVTATTTVRSIWTNSLLPAEHLRGHSRAYGEHGSQREDVGPVHRPRVTPQNAFQQRHHIFEWQQPRHRLHSRRQRAD